MAKVKVNENDSLPFPKYMIAGNGDIIYAEKPSEDPLCLTGMCIKAVGTSYQGEYSESWDKGSFRDFKGTIKIEQ